MESKRTNKKTLTQSGFFILEKLTKQIELGKIDIEKKLREEKLIEKYSRLALIIGSVFVVLLIIFSKIREVVTCSL
jgi:hypothetical protein